MATTSSSDKKKIPHPIPEDSFAPAAAVGLCFPAQCLHSIAWLDQERQPRGQAAAQITPKPHARSLGK